MNNISDKLVMTIILITILFVFGLIFSVKSPERKVIDSQIIWKGDYSNISIHNTDRVNSSEKRILKKNIFAILPKIGTSFYVNTKYI